MHIGAYWMPEHHSYAINIIMEWSCMLVLCWRHDHMLLRSNFAPDKPIEDWMCVFKLTYEACVWDVVYRFRRCIICSIVNRPWSNPMRFHIGATPRQDEKLVSDISSHLFLRWSPWTITHTHICVHHISHSFQSFFDCLTCSSKLITHSPACQMWVDPDVWSIRFYWKRRVGDKRKRKEF